MMRSFFSLTGLLLILAVSMAVALAYEGDRGEIIVADALNGPRHIFIDSDGTIYVAEAGNGGETATKAALLGDALAGNTGQITAVANGEQSVFMGGLFSVANSFGQSLGPHAVYLTEDTVWVLMGQGPVGGDMTMPDPVFALVAYDRATKEQKQVVDLYANETANNPDGFDIDSNPTDFVVAEDGTVYIADAGANAILKWTADGGVQTLAAWAPEDGKPQPVPDALALGPDGNLYAGFLTGFPFLPGAAWIDVLDTDGNSLRKIEGLTLVTDLMFASDGTLYAVQFASGFGDLGFIPDSGSIVKVTDARIEPVVTGLNYPFGIAESPDSGFLVSVCASFQPPNQGQVILVQAGMDFSESPEPAETPEPVATEETGG